jgi:hypothetical protein
MNEKAILSLVAHAVRQVLRGYGASWPEKEEALIAEHIADVAWTALIVGAREALVRGEPLVIEEFGRLEFKGKSLRFDPADSLHEAAAASLPADEGSQLLAERTLYLLSTAAALARRVPAETYISADLVLSPEEKLIGGIFGGNVEQEKKKFTEVVKEKLRAIGPQPSVDVGLGYGGLRKRDLQLDPFPFGNFPVVGDGLLRVKVVPEYDGTVMEIADEEATVEFAPGRTGTLHYSQIPNASEGRIGDVLKVGQQITVRILDDSGGVVRLTAKTASAVYQPRPDLSAG